jgi:hypothetical protein
MQLDEETDLELTLDTIVRPKRVSSGEVRELDLEYETFGQAYLNEKYGF